MMAAHIFWTNHQVNQDMTRLKAIVASLAQSDPEYADLKVFRSTEPRAFLFGTLNSRERVETLREKVAEQFGAEKARRIVSLIRVSSSTTRGS